MVDRRYLKDRAWLYVPFFLGVSVICAAILVLPYETVYVRSRAYLNTFLVIVSVCVFVFFAGTLFNMLLWMKGKGLRGTPERRLLRLFLKGARVALKDKFSAFAKSFIKDALYLSRLKERSALRWFMHLMILGGFALMFVLDILVTLSLDALHYEPMIREGGWAKLWIRDFGFELAGAMMLLGLAVAAARRFVWKPKIVRTELPDATSIVFLLLVVLGGFILEGMGIAGSIPSHESDQGYSFLGYALSLLMPGSAGEYYDQAWLVHGVMSALLIAYIPFSKLFHMIATPIAIEVDRLLGTEVAS